MRSFTLLGFALLLASCAQSQPAPTSPKAPLRALIISGGPSPDYNQYAIESNARYVEKLTTRASARRILFADGSKTSRTISTLQVAPDQKEQLVFSSLFDLEEPDERIIYRASTLPQIDGAATKASVLKNVAWLASQAKTSEKSLLYFTGHGSPGSKRQISWKGIGQVPDYENTVYSLWNDDELSTQELARALKNWPPQAPLFLVMVQCHAGGFANLLFEGGDPTRPLINRDFCGFFAATGERQASGCTSEVDETDYQDFTTHFFAALSGTSRDGKPVTGADYDRSGSVSMLEAMAWTNLNDASIDVPLCTSDTYLRTLFPQTASTEWMKTPYSALLQNAAPWQKATLNGLSRQLGLTGEKRIEAALQKQRQALKESGRDDTPFPASLDKAAIYKRYDRLKAQLTARLPALKSPSTSQRFKNARPAALRFLATRQQDVEVLASALKQWDKAGSEAETREAVAWRFIRAMRTLFLESRLQREGSAVQKAAFKRLRAAESRNPLR